MRWPHEDSASRDCCSQRLLFWLSSLDVPLLFASVMDSWVSLCWCLTLRERKGQLIREGPCSPKPPPHQLCSNCLNKRCSSWPWPSPPPQEQKSCISPQQTTDQTEFPVTKLLSPHLPRQPQTQVCQRLCQGPDSPALPLQQYLLFSVENNEVPLEYL